MNDWDISLFLLDLTKKEQELLWILYFIYGNPDKKDCYTIEEIGKFLGIKKKIIIEDTLNKLLIRNIVGRIVYESPIIKNVIDNFDNDFLSVLYDKQNPLDSAKKKAGFYIDNIDKYYVLNPIIKSWKFIPKAKVVSSLKRLKKVINNDFVEYLLESYNYGKKGDKRVKANSRLNGWNVKQMVEMFREKYKIFYGNNYNAGSSDYGLMKKLLIQLSDGAMPRDNISLFFDYAFERAISRDYVLQIAGLKYYANEYLTNIVKNKTGIK